MNVAALDPGRDKCGLALLSGEGGILLQKVIATEALEREVEDAIARYGAGVILLGNGTTSGAAETRIRRALPDLPLLVVDEYRTTEQARKEYWKAHPPKGLWRLLPTGMRVPDVPVDDFVAVILARRYLGEV